MPPNGLARRWWKSRWRRVSIARMEGGWWKSLWRRVSITRMEDIGDTNAKRLIDNGVIPGPDPPPEPYASLIEKLSIGEVDALISIKGKFDKANVADGGKGSFMGFVVPL